MTQVAGQQQRKWKTETWKLFQIFHFLFKDIMGEGLKSKQQCLFTMKVEWILVRESRSLIPILFLGLVLIAFTSENALSNVTLLTGVEKHERA